MTWTYDPTKLNDPTQGPLMQVRLMVEDTVTSDQQLQDEEINWIVSQEGAIEMAAARAADTIAARYSRQADRSVGQMRLSASQRAKAYLDLAARLRYLARTNVTPYAGGISVSDKQSNEADTDRVAPGFWRDMMKNPGMLDPTDQPLEGLDTQ